MRDARIPLRTLRATDVPCFRAVATLLLKEFQTGAANSGTVLELTALDPGLCARLIGLAASTVPLVPPVSLDDAVAVLGLPRCLRTLDRVATETVLLETDDKVAWDLWRHAVTTACAARVLASYTADLPGAWAYSAGLLHDLGRLPLYHLLRRDYLELYERALVAREPVVDSERRHLGTDHAEAGRALAEELHLPSVLVAAIWLHHRPLAEEGIHVKARQLAEVVALADAIAHRVGGDYDFRERDPELEAQLAELLGISPRVLQEVADEVPRAVHEATARVTRVAG